MALQQHEIKALAIQLAATLPPQSTEILLATGEAFDVEAMNLARAYMAATGPQRRALQAVVESWGASASSQGNCRTTAVQSRRPPIEAA